MVRASPRHHRERKSAPDPEAPARERAPPREGAGQAAGDAGKYPRVKVDPAMIVVSKDEY